MGGGAFGEKKKCENSSNTSSTHRNIILQFTIHSLGEKDEGGGGAQRGNTEGNEGVGGQIDLASLKLAILGGQRLLETHTKSPNKGRGRRER